MYLNDPASGSSDVDALPSPVRLEILEGGKFVNVNSDNIESDDVFTGDSSFMTQSVRSKQQARRQKYCDMLTRLSWRLECNEMAIHRSAVNERFTNTDNSLHRHQGCGCGRCKRTTKITFSRIRKMTELKQSFDVMELWLR